MSLSSLYKTIFLCYRSHNPLSTTSLNMNNQIIADDFPVTLGDRQLQYMQSRAIDLIQTAPSFNKYHFNQSPVMLKRQRDYAFDSDALMTARKRRSVAFVPPQSLIEAQLVSQIQQQQTDIDLFVAQQTQTLRLELEARQRTQTLSLVSAVQSVIVKKLKQRDDEIVRMGKLNYVLQERVKSLYVENQILRDLAQTNEATANTLRSNLEHVLAQVDELPATAATGGDVFHPPLEEDAVSSCGSCDGADGNDFTAGTGGCKRCGERTASVLVLPCRHLCLCTVCGSALLQACPVCDTVMNASVHVNMS
ncbi:BOI-related E3 ubiquitin-protein ligase 1 [Brassica napus]|nr:PREDICTED: BOI-related E3 ubiquitin-protein ligase 1 [Brassica oleracea var. oleracea]XP_013713857.1 BOI-related E3 ubiquitin-protein ligase 1 [Brassica napus]